MLCEWLKDRICEDSEKWRYDIIGWKTGQPNIQTFLEEVKLVGRNVNTEVADDDSKEDCSAITVRFLRL